ncbi:hypothetical protein B0H10DRAFT_2243442 [Mycena sp. CBHHK59/15]|nr:hypothetical protein B0H10DRAFT_2243442 [Mycena sp. CBHHK59/15]
MTHRVALAGSKLRVHTTRHGAAQTHATPTVPRQREHLFEDEVVWAVVREWGTEDQAHTDHGTSASLPNVALTVPAGPAPLRPFPFSTASPAAPTADLHQARSSLTSSPRSFSRTCSAVGFIQCT